MKLAVKKTVKPNSVEKDIKDIEARILEKEKQIASLRIEVKKLKESSMALRILPFKFGDEVYCEVSYGKSKQWVKGVLEYYDGTLYFRPYKKGSPTLSERNFIIMENSYAGKTYKDLIKRTFKEAVEQSKKGE